ncbi:MAG: hypothetical protein ACLFR1_12780 [Spirochaetia bacterium]
MSVWNKVQDALNDGLETSRKLFNKAKDKATEMGETSVVRFELLQLEKRLEKLFGKLGTEVYETLMVEGKNTVSKKTASIRSLLDEIEETRNEIEKREKELNTQTE